jgi:hypothetical protein
MKYLILLPALVFVLFTALSAEDWYGINLPEELHYRISYFAIVAGYGSIKAESTEFEGRKAVYIFDYQQHECTSRDGTVKISEGLLEPLGALFYLRINELKKGIPVKKEVFDGLTVKEVTTVAMKEERIKTRLGPKQVIIIKPLMKDFRKAGITQVQENITLYLQKELPRLPYLVKGKLVIGSLKATLTEINH